VTEFCDNTRLATLLGKKKLSLITMADDKGDLSKIDPKKIIVEHLEDLPGDACRLFEEQKVCEQVELQMFF
jgi:hypothetical protein